MSRLNSNAAGGEHATRFQCDVSALQYAKTFLDNGMSYQAAAKASGVNELTLREMLVKAPARAVVPNIQQAPDPIKRPRVAKSVRAAVVTPHGRIALVIARVAAEYGVTADDIMGDVRSRNISWARHAAFYAVKAATGASLLRLGRIFNRDHSTILHGIRMHKARAVAAKTALAA